MSNEFWDDERHGELLRGRGPVVAFQCFPFPCLPLLKRGARLSESTQASQIHLPHALHVAAALLVTAVVPPLDSHGSLFDNDE
jgi:hypothetical protein